MRITLSRYTPNLQNGENVNFDIGEVVDYRLRSGEEIKITIDSEYMMNESDGEIHYGYEAIFHDDGKRYFAAAKGIYNWEGKV